MKKRLTTTEITARKGSMPLVCLTAYTAPFTRVLDKHCDVLLVGDTLGMLVYGMDSTREVTVEMMAAHGKAVVKASSNACVVVDLPFGSYEQGPEQAYETASRIIKQTGAQAVKLEGGASMQKTIAFLIQKNIQVMGHVGLLPQHVEKKEDYRYQGREDSAAKQILADAKAVEEAGAFAMVVEAVPATLAEKITHHVNIPVIGIGASHHCDGQILVTEDMAGMFTEFKPKFVRRYGQLADDLDKAAAAYSHDVKARLFPGAKEML